MTERGLGRYFFLLAFSWRPGCNEKETAEQNSKFQETLTYLFLYFCATNPIFDRHFISSRAPCYVLHVHEFCSQCFFLSNSIHFTGEMSKRHLVEGSDRWNNRLFLGRYDHPWAETKNKTTFRNTEKIDSWQKPWRPDGLWQQFTTTTAVHSNLANVHLTSVFINVKHLYRGLP